MILNRKIQVLFFFLRDKGKKKWCLIVKEFVSLWLSEKRIPVTYITSFHYRKNVSDYKDFLSLKENEKLLQWSYSLGKKQIDLVKSKLLFEDLMVKNNVPTPQIFFHNSKNEFTYKGSILEIEDKNTFFDFLSRFFERENTQRIFCKPKKGNKGQSIFILYKKTFLKTDETLIQSILMGEFIFQEVVIQHESLNTINKDSVNTLRVVTYKNENNEIEILSGFIRLGRSGAIVDNAHAGGIVVSFNKETGKMKREGIQLIDNGGGVFCEHPDTGIVFENHQIPCYDQVKDIVKHAASLMQIPLLGWDIAITPDGPIIVEANHDFYLLLSDRMENGLKKLPIINQLLASIRE